MEDLAGMGLDLIYISPQLESPALSKVHLFPFGKDKEGTPLALVLV
jgi:hypothetical protein